jgi:hypothetical protein
MGKRHHKKPAMPQRPRQHELDTEAVEYIRGNLPASWTRQETVHDYGIDLGVEIFEDGEATSLEFRIQSKGHERFVILHNEQVIQQLEVAKLNYYERLPLPVLLVIYSSQKKQACYLWIKPYIRQVLDIERPGWRDLNGKSKISIHVPLSNVFDETSFVDIHNHVETEISKIRLLSAGDFLYTSRPKPIYTEFAASTRLIRPGITNYLHRSRLTDAISIALPQSSVFIQADAGYGKTWLLLDFINTNKPPISIWYTFTKDTIEASRFIEELASEFFRQTKQVGSVTLGLFQNRAKETRPDEALAVLVTEVASSPTTSILLVLEDLHNTNETVYSTISSLLNTHPKNLQIILTSRLPLPTNEAKLVAQGQLCIIDRTKLEFSLDETRDFLKSIAGLDLSPEQVKLIQDRTGGWVAAVGLAIEVLYEKAAKSEDLFTRLTGFEGNIYNFFAEEVYRTQSNEIRWLLKRLSIVRLIQPVIVNLFTERADGGQVLKDLARRNTFLIKDQVAGEQYRIHTLFAEFLMTRFQDEEGTEAVHKANNKLAIHYFSNKEWYLAADHAINAEDWKTAIQSLEILGPIGVSMGYGQVFLEWIEKIPKEQRNRSSLICELVGLSAYQIGDLDIASQEFEQAQSLSKDQQDNTTLNRLEYYSGEINLDKGLISPEQFLEIANKVTIWSYQHNEILFGVQVELRLVQVGQTISLKYSNLLPQLVKRSEAMIIRIESLGGDYEIIKAKVLSSQAHILFQVVTLKFQQEAGKIQLREKFGHPIKMDERVSQAKDLINGMHLIWNLYSEAEKIAKDKSEIEWAVFRTSHLGDFAHHQSQIYLMGLARVGETSPQGIELESRTKTQLLSILAEIDRCVQIFGKYHLMYALAKSICDAADIYDILGDTGNRDRLAKETLEIASERKFVELTERAQNLLLNRNTFTSLREKTTAKFNDREIANLAENGKADYINILLRAFAGDVNIDKIRAGIASDVDDMVASAKQRLEWCRHVEVIQDLRHTKSLGTIYREIPQKKIVCMELGYESPMPGLSFDKLWPMFKGGFCLGCSSRSLEK